MSSFDSLTLALEDWFDTRLADLPDALRQRVLQEFSPLPWDTLSADQRRSVALQLDYQHDPATEKDRQEWWDFFERMAGIKAQIAQWDAVATPTASELALKETRLTELRQELARMDAQVRHARGDYFPERKLIRAKSESAATAPTQTVRYIPYPKAMDQLTARLGATPEELAAWAWVGPAEGGLAAYVNANELEPPPRFHFGFGGDFDYVARLMGAWFLEAEIAHFEPSERYITGEALIKRWGEKPGLKPEPFILAKIAESRLEDIHPMYGGTRGTFRERDDFPPLEAGLFLLSQVERIEAEDFGDDGTGQRPGNPPLLSKGAVGSTRRRVDPVDMAGMASQGSTVRREARKLNTQARYKSWQKAYRDSVKRHPDKSDVWHSQQIAKMAIAKGRDPETIRKHMKS